MINYSIVRRKRAYVSTLNTVQLHLRNPYVIAFWSMLFPGLGHILLSKYLRGYILFLWEVVINLMANINLAIYYSCIGDFELAKSVIDKKWVMLYIPTFVFAMWDSYRTTVDSNHQFLLAAREDAEIEVSKLSAVEINYIDKADARATSAWSAFMPGIGHLAIHELPTAFFILIWWIVIVYYSNFFPAALLTFTGHLKEAVAAIDKQWFLNIPSIYFFAIYSAYVNTVERNNLFDWEQSKFFNKYYQNKNFPMPISANNRGERMYIVSTFEHSINLESAVTSIQMQGVAKESILAVPLALRGEERRLFDTLHHSDGVSMLDVPMLCAALVALVFSIYGFVWSWGPIVWGVIGTFTGFGLGMGIKLITTGKYPKRKAGRKLKEVVLIIDCRESQAEMVKETLWEHHALGVRKLDLGSDAG